MRDSSYTEYTLFKINSEYEISVWVRNQFEAWFTEVLKVHKHEIILLALISLYIY